MNDGARQRGDKMSRGGNLRSGREPCQEYNLRYRVKERRSQDANSKAPPVPLIESIGLQGVQGHGPGDAMPSLVFAGQLHGDNQRSSSAILATRLEEHKVK